MARPLVVQHGSASIWPLKEASVDFMPFSDVIEYMRGARVVITPPGVGSVMASASAERGESAA